MPHTGESNFSNFVSEYLSEIETEFENTLACLSGAQMSSNHEKTGGRKSRDTQTSVTDLFKVSLNLDMNNPKNRKINYNKLNRKAVFRIRIQGLKKI